MNKSSNKVRLFIFISLIWGCSLTAKNYYIDASVGNDNNSGLTEQMAWKTLTKVNATTFQAGDSILFKAGDMWVGSLYPRGSGSEGRPIVIDRYGIGERPHIDGNGMTGTGAIYLYNQSYWEINNLEVTNDGPTEGDRRGVRIEINEGIGIVNHIYLRNLHVHHIKGKVGQQRSHKRTSGIGFAVVTAKKGVARFNDILVENCLIHDCQNQGIITECVSGDGYQPRTAIWNNMRITNAVIRNNTIYNISKNAMIIRLFDKGVVENNVCYNTANGITGNTIFSCACDSTIFQFNEGYLNNSPDADGSLYDADLRSPNTIWQYSYSHDNAHGLFWNCTVQEDANVICRYNISQNDRGIIFCVNYPVSSLSIYNNTVYIPSHLSPIIISERNNGNKSGQANTRTYDFNNNIIYNLSPTASYLWTKTRYSRTFKANCFYGKHPLGEPTDALKITSDPMFVEPGSGGIGINSVDGYQLQKGSPCIDSGVEIKNNGGRDYWGNPLYTGKPDIGAHESVDTTGLNPTQTFDFFISIDPTTGKPVIQLSGQYDNKKLTINIFNTTGKIIYSKLFTASESINIDDCPSLNQGVYIVSVTVDTKTRAKKLITI